MRRTLPLLSAAVLLVVGCGGDEVVDFGPAAPTDEQPELPADGGVDLADVAPPDEVPPEDARLTQVDWPAAASWIRRENEAGRPVVVNFFASFCEPCKRELPLLLETADAEDGVSFLGVHTNEQLALGERMLDDYDIAFPTLHDPVGDVVFEVGGRGLPHTVAFDTDGRLVGRVFGELTETSLGQLLDEVR